jgi:hypothetical protein
MVELSLVERLIRYVFLYWTLPGVILILTPIRKVVDFLTITNPDFFHPWTWATEQERQEARSKHSKKVLDIQEQV